MATSATIRLARAIPLHMEADNFDNESIGGDSLSINSYASVGAPLPEYVLQFNRDYLNLGEDRQLYVPSDHKESKRQSYQYWLLKALFNQVDVFAPLVSPRRILDIGCGTGKWCHAVAEKYPSAKVVASDIHPHVEDATFPENVEVVSEDATLGDFGDHPYSYIHTRQMAGVFADFRAIINRAYEYLEPGGWMESQEMYTTLYCDDDTIKPDNQFLLWNKKLDEAYMAVERPIRIANKIKGWYEKAGFTDVHEEIYKLPVNEWPKDPKFKTIGRFNSISLREGLAPLSFKAFYECFGMEHHQTEIELTGVKEALMDKRVHYYYNVYVVWGKKPETAQVGRLGPQ